MFLNFQTQADIRNEIRSALGELRRPATAAEVGAAIWFRGAVDGTQSGVYQTVAQEIKRMASEGEIEVVEDRLVFGKYMPYYRAGPLDRLAHI